MHNMIELATNKVLNDLVDTTIREAIVLKKAANDQGVSALCNVLWRLLGGCPADSVDAIHRIVAENKSEILGHDSQDYIKLFMDAFKGRG